MAKKLRLKRGEVVLYRYSSREVKLNRAVVEKVARSRVHARAIEGDEITPRVVAIPFGLIDKIEDERIDLDSVVADKVKSDLEAFKARCSMPEQHRPAYLRQPERFYYTSRFVKGTEKDRNRQAVYDAETAASRECGVGEEFVKVRHCQMYVDYVLGSKWTIDRFGEISVNVEEGRSKQKSYARGNLIRLMKGPRHKNELTLLHELAHIIVPSSAESHGRFWRAVYLDMMSMFMGEGEAETMRLHFENARLFCDPYSRSPF